MAWSTPYTLLIIGLVAAPSLIARTIHEVTGDPLWQYLAIDEERLAAAERDIESDSPLVRIRIFWRGPDAVYETPQDLAHALRKTFESKGVTSFIAVMQADASGAEGRTTVELRAGTNTFGPFPVVDAARNVQPAVNAARFAFGPGNTSATR